MMVSTILMVEMDRLGGGPVAEDAGGVRQMLTTTQVADLLQVSANTVRALADSGQIPSRRIGRVIRYPYEPVARFASGEAVDKQELAVLERVRARKRSGNGV